MMTWWMAGALAAPAQVFPWRVVGGAPVDEGGWPDVAGIVFRSGSVGCTGTLVAPDAVLTAGHCAGDITDVILGTNDLDRGGELIPVVETVEYPDSQHTYDVAVLKLAWPASVPPRPVAVDCVLAEHLVDGAAVAVVGYGATNAAGTEQGDVLNEGYTAVADADCSEDEVDGWESGCNPGVRPGGEIAAGGGGVDTCFGDSGGPLYLLTPDGDFLVGATSRGYPGAPWDEPCLYGGVYTRPDAVLDWLEAQVGPIAKPVCNLPPAPVAPPIEIEEGSTGRTVVDVNDPDVRTGTVSYAIVSDPANGTATVGPDGEVTYAPAPGFVGEDTVLVEVDDGGQPDWPRTGPALTGRVEVRVNVRHAAPGRRQVWGL
jgi:endonuclease G